MMLVIVQLCKQNRKFALFPIGAELLVITARVQADMKRCQGKEILHG